AGNIAIFSNTIEIDTTPPVITGGLDVASDSGVEGDGITNVRTPTFTGTGEVGARVTLNIDGQTHSTFIDENGQWSITVNTLSGDGVKNYSFYAVDRAGNQSATQTYEMTLDTITEVTARLSVGSDTGFFNDDGITKETRPFFSGTAEPGATVTIELIDANNQQVRQYPVTVQANGNWSVQITEALPEGEYTYNVHATDIAGNEATATGQIEIDLTAPTPFTGGLDPESDSGVSNTDKLTNVTLPTFTGTGEAGARVTLNLDNQNHTV
ncbi:Ig-like domain-containing protein, partial [Arthrospira platensis SPKY1]|nr:Ig-like domain-containing protein [Arthrospira platensis SPKY1]